MVEQTLATQQPDVQSGPPGEERRRAPRFQCLRMISCAVRQSEERIWARVRDISVSGIGLVATNKIEAGTPLIIELKSVALLPTLTLPARVAHATPRASGSWLIGCQFDEPLTDEQVQALL
jgi:hypothetical protein